MLNYFILGTGASYTFDINNEKNKDVVTFSHFRDAIKENIENAKLDRLRLWKVCIDTRNKRDKYLELKKSSAETDVEKNFEGKELEPSWEIAKSFPTTLTEHIHIIVQPPSPAITAGPSRSITQVTPPEPTAIFEEFLNSKHGRFLKTYIKQNDALPSFDPKISPKISVPATSSGKRPSLLLHNLPEDCQKHKPITQISDVQSAIIEAKNNLLIFLGTSGCGKTRTCYEILCENWGLYFVASRKGNGGSADIEAIETHLSEKLTQNFEENRRFAENIVRCAILSRLLILCHCMNSASEFSKHRWLLIQTCQKNFGNLYEYNDDIFLELMLRLNVCTPLSVMTCIDKIYQQIQQISSDKKKFIIILDETQVLEGVLRRKFKVRRNDDKRSLLSPVVQSLREPTASMRNHCFIPCGTGLGILSLEKVLMTGISKPDQEVDKYTKFGEWQDIAHVKNYVSKLVVLTEDEYRCLYDHFHGRFRPIVSCIEEIIMGKTFANAVDEHWKLITQDKEDEQSLYKQLVNIINRKRPNHVRKMNILELYKSITLVYYYSGAPFLFTDINQMTIVESGFGRFRSVNPPTASQLERMYDNENILCISSVNTDLMFPARAEEDALVAFVDEPFALEAAFNFFNDHDSLPKEILNTMCKVNNASSCGFLWETYLTTEFEKIFDGSTNIRNMPMFDGINDFPNTFVGSPKIVRSPKSFVERVASSTTGYTLDKFFSEIPELRPTFYFPEFFCGPDLIFFVQFENQIVVPVFVQLKLRYSLKIIENVLNGLHPTMFYKRKDGKITNGELNKPIIKKIIELCEKVCSIGILVAYPADVFNKIPIITNDTHNLRTKKPRFLPQQTIYKQQCDQITEKQQQLIGIIDRENASRVFQADHLSFLNALKYTMKEYGEYELEEVEVKGNGKKVRPKVPLKQKHETTQ
ncbi:hypothetical protein C1645_839928 [Glomus cerebriforme]|uniref:Crinkler effector protein N-terminal domain-containing protein n=1 Tax=Glomus cerebriforme TaxID=658196 RepID=A0A397S4Z2_9GLOM|nr:hypothetical protein C1645_839928 [Glomus cerebriforme]